MKTKKQVFIEFALKYQKLINTVFIILISFYLYITISWNEAFEVLFAIPSDILKVINSIFAFISTFLNKFYNDLITYPTNLKIISVGILKRFLFEDIIFPLLGKFYFKIIKDDLILYYRLKTREFKKFPIFLRTALASPFVASIVAVVSYFKVLSFVFFGIKKIFTNTIFSKLKFIFIKWIPALYIIAIDMPIISIIIDYFALVKIISWIQSIKLLGINFIIDLFSNIAKALDKKIQSIQNFFYGNIGLFLRNRAIITKYKIRNKIDKILSLNFDDYHVLSKGYNNISFKKKILRLKKWKIIKKQNKISKRKKSINLIKLKIKKIF